MEGCQREACQKQLLLYGEDCEGSDDEKHHCEKCEILFLMVCPSCSVEWKHPKCAMCLGREDLIYNSKDNPISLCPDKCWEWNDPDSDH